MSAGSSQTPWTASEFSPGQIYGTDPTPETTLEPYRVKLGDTVYDQSDFTHNTTHRYHNFTSGIGAGKTVAGVIRAIANAEEWNAGEMGMIITPTSLGIKNVILPELSKWGILDRWDYKGPQSEAPGLHLPNGGRILLESADNDRKIERLRGPSLAWFWMDEAALIPEKAWRILTGRLRSGNYRNAFVTTTPKGFNWIHEKFINDTTRVDGVNNVVGVPSYANHHLPHDYRTDILDDYGGQFAQQEVLGKFVQFEGLVYPWFNADHVDEGGHVVTLDSENITADVGTIQEVFYGVDWGFYPHPAAIVVFARTGFGWTVALGEHYETRNTTDDLADVLQRMYGSFGRGPVYCDPSEPANIEEFQRAGIDARKADNSVEPGIQHVTSLEDSFRVAETCQSLINEMNQYRYKDGGDEPVDKNDHACDATRYALFTHSQQGGHNIGVAFGD